ncbi:hypothetical protein ACFLTL_01935 [Chloroflexota bacterium]
MITAAGSVLIIIGVIMVLSQLNFNGAIPIESNTPSQSPASPAVPEPPKIPTFIDMSKINPEQQISVTLGGMTAIWPLSVLEKERKTAFNLGGANIDMYVKDGKLYVDADVSDGISDYPIEIRGFSFLVNPENWDKNYDNNAFEVVNQEGKPVFQFILESQYSFILRGVFPIPGGGVVWATESLSVINPSPFEIFSLVPIFKYPSSEFQGERVIPFVSNNEGY